MVEITAANGETVKLVFSHPGVRFNHWCDVWYKGRGFSVYLPKFLVFFQTLLLDAVSGNIDLSSMQLLEELFSDDHNDWSE